MADVPSALFLPDGTTWPNPLRAGEVEWSIRYGDPTREELLTAASVLAAYQHLLWAPRRRRDQVVRMIRGELADG